ncbi:MAG: DsbA family protein, partial [Janthinobacterium lividum]
IVSFYDYNCSYCKKGDKYLSQLLESDSKIKVILKPFPILGEYSMYAAKIALAVYKLEPSKFKAIHEGLMNSSQPTKTMITELLTTEDLDPSKVIEESESQEIKDVINKNFSLAGNLRIQGAPAYIINGKLMPGLLNLNALQQIVSESREQH